MLTCGSAWRLPDLEVVEVVRRRDLHRARALLGIRIFVGDDGDAAADQRQDHVLADERLVALVVGMHGDGGVAEHGLGPRGGDDDVGRCIVGVEGAVLERIAQMPEVALHLDLLDFEVGDGGEQLRVPIDEALVLVDQPGAVEIDEHLAHGAGQPLVHGEALARPVAGGAEPLQLIDDQPAGLVLPLPDAARRSPRGPGRGGSAPGAPSIAARPPSAWRCRHDPCPGCHSTSRPRMRSKRTSMSCSVLLSACPICSEPVTFGGGMTMAKGRALVAAGLARGKRSSVLPEAVGRPLDGRGLIGLVEHRRLSLGEGAAPRPTI